VSDFVLTERTDGVLKVILNRVDKRNALTIEFVEDIAAAVRSADEDPAIRAVVVLANGPTFSAGIDVMALATMRAQAADQNAARWLRRFAERLQHALHTIEQTEVPVIGALHGKVLGLGLELALAFDLRVASEGTELGLPEAKLGLVADVGGTTRLAKLVGPSRAKDMLMTARNLHVDEALSWGLINRTASEGQAVDAALRLAHEIAANAPLAVGLAKLLVDQGEGVDRYTQMVLERLAQSYLVTTEDVGEAMGAFLEKRPPAWKGK
jgi:enoyl-CoA hydratase